MFRIDAMSRQPVYEQLVEQAERMILNGLLHPGDQLPSVRSLSIQLSINPNTIQKAYSELDGRGLSYSVPGIGCFVAEDAPARLGEYARTKLDDLRGRMIELALAGIPRADIDRLVGEAYAGSAGPPGKHAGDSNNKRGEGHD